MYQQCEILGRTPPSLPSSNTLPAPQPPDSAYARSSIGTHQLTSVLMRASGILTGKRRLPRGREGERGGGRERERGREKGRGNEGKRERGRGGEGEGEGGS
jgi:hypothetical protein